jgi:hypothetical protein
VLKLAAQIVLGLVIAALAFWLLLEAIGEFVELLS